MSNIITKENESLELLEKELNEAFSNLRIESPIVYGKNISLHNGVYRGTIVVV